MIEASRGFSLTTAAFVVVSSTLGGGIFGSAGYVVLDAGGHGPAILAWLVGGLIAVCGALSLAEISASLPRSGGEFVILSEAYGPLIGFLGGWVSLVFGFVAPIAATGSAAAVYLLAPFKISNLVATRTLATVAIAVLAITHAAGRSRTERIQGIATAATIAVLGLFIVAGLGMGLTLDVAPTVPSRGGGFAFAGFFVGLIRVSYAYTGWNGASYLAGEIAEPQRALPRAILLGTGTVLVLYLGLVSVFALAVPAAELRALSAGPDPLAVERIGDLAARRLFGARLDVVTALAVGVVLMAALSAMILTGPRVAFAMAREGRMPAILGRASLRGDTPAVATTVVALAAVVMLWTGSFDAITYAAGVGLALNSLLTVAAIFVLRYRRPDLPRPFRTPGYPIVPLLYLGLTTAALVVSFLDSKQRTASLVGLAGVLSAIPAYMISTRWRTTAGEG